MNKKVESIQYYAKRLISVDSSASLKTVCSLMLSEEISYLPIVDNKGTRNVGVYKRKDLFKWFISNPHKSIDKVDKSEFKSAKFPEVSMETSLQKTMHLLHDNPALLIKDDGYYTHLITPRVVANVLEEYSERFLIYETLEKTIRDLIVSRGIRLEELDDTNLKKPFPNEVEKLEFGQYIAIFSMKWDSLGLSHLDQKLIIAYLNNAKLYRNALMHFRLKDELAGLEDAKKLLKLLG
jgi:hypothetical protein